MQIDGASDNVNFTNIHFFVWFLSLMGHLDYPLRHVYLCRLIVGHTHNDVDMCHSLSSQKRKRCHSNLWSFSSYKRWLEDVHRSELMQFFDIDRCYNFKEFLKEMRHDTDEKVDTWMHIHLELRSDGKQNLVQNQTKNGS